MKTSVLCLVQHINKHLNISTGGKIIEFVSGWALWLLILPKGLIKFHIFLGEGGLILVPDGLNISQD